MINIVTENYSLFVQKINLSVNELIEQTCLTKHETLKLEKYTNEKRKIEWLGVRYLLQKFHNKSSIIIYNENGKPSLNTGENISISHSYGIVGILISKNNSGLDIEQIRSKIDRIKHKFLNQNELAFIENSTNKITDTTIFWSCKETLLKIYGKTDIIFDEQLSVNINNHKNIIGHIKTPNANLTINLNLQIVDNYVVVWGVENL